MTRLPSPSCVLYAGRAPSARDGDVAVGHDHETRAGAGRTSDVEEFEQAIVDLARVIGHTAIETEMRDEYVPVIRYLAQARRALREIYGK